MVVKCDSRVLINKGVNVLDKKVGFTREVLCFSCVLGEGGLVVKLGMVKKMVVKA